MVNVLVGDLFASGAQTLVNTVNCVGVMGKGVALEFRKRFPEMYKDYVARCARREVHLGEPYLFRTLVPPWILNFPTKDHWRSVSRLSDIVVGLEYLLRHYREWGITSLAVPPLGCGQGQLDWRVVGPTLYAYLDRLDIPVELYAPHEVPLEQTLPAFLAPTERDTKAVAARGAPRVAPAMVAVVEIVARIVRERYHWPVGRITFQKIAYFATVAGIPTGLQFVKGSYGPFSPMLKPEITKLVNNGLLDETPAGNMLEVRPGRTFADAERTYRPQLAEWEPGIERVSDLFLRIRGTSQAEVAATVHFAAQSLEASRHDRPSESEVLDEVKRWKQQRKPPLPEDDVVSAIRNLNAMGWVDLVPSEELHADDELELAI